MTRPPLEVADIVRQYGDAYLVRYGTATSTTHRRVLHAIGQCRTASLGGHKAQGDHCGHEEISYNPAAIGTVPRARAVHRPLGSRPASASSWERPTAMSFFPSRVP